MSSIDLLIEHSRNDNI